MLDFKERLLRGHFGSRYWVLVRLDSGFGSVLGSGLRLFAERLRGVGPAVLALSLIHI